MSVSKVRLLALGLTAAGLVAAGALTNVGQAVRNGLQLNAAEPVAGDPARVAEAAKPASRDDNDVHVNAPGTQVSVDKASGKVSVTAPHTDVRVDPDKGQVRVRAPYVNLDIRW